MHEHWVPAETLTPPFSQGFFSAQGVLAFSRGTATRNTGRRTARMTMMKITTQMSTKIFRGIPQHVFLRRGALGSSSLELSCSTLRKLERPKNTGHDAVDPRASGVAKPGGGKEASISDKEPELRGRCPKHNSS